MSEQPMNDDQRKDCKESRNILSRRTFLSYTLGASGAVLAAGMAGATPFVPSNATVTTATYGNTGDRGCSTSGLHFESVGSMKAASLQAGISVRTTSYYAIANAVTDSPRGGALYRIVTRTDYDALRENSLGPEGALNGNGYIDHLLANGNVAVLSGGGAVDLASVGLREQYDAYAADNTAAMQAALAYPLPVLTAYGIYVFSGESVADLGQEGELDISGDCRFRLAAGTIVNTDADYSNHKAILRVQGGKRFTIRGVAFDGNRDGQTYPATKNNFGRGTVPRRTNGILEVCPSGGVYRTQKALVEQCSFENAYLSGAMFIQCGNVTIRNNYSANNTINGFGGAGLSSLLFEGNTSWRDGWSDIYTSDRYEGDRAQLQIREWPRDYTAATERIPVISIAESERNKQIVVRGNTSDQAGVIALFVRSCEQCLITDNVIRNVGYKRRSGSYSPTSIWGDFGKFAICGNDIMTQAVQPGDMPPDGIRVVGFSGNGVDRIGGPWISMQGRYYSIVADNQITCGQTFGSGAFDDNASKRLLNNKGIIISSQCLVRGNVIEGCANIPIEAINDDNFSSESLRDIGICGNEIFNTTGSSVINLRSYGSPAGNPRNFDISGNKVYDVRSVTAGSDARQMVNFSPAWGAFDVQDVTVADNRFYCLNTGDATKNYGGVRFRGSSGSRGIVIRDNQFFDTLNAVRTESFAELCIRGNTVRNGLRLLYADIAAGGDAGKLMIDGNSCSGITSQCVNINAGGSGKILSELTAIGNSWSGSGSGYSGVSPGVSPIVYCLDRNIDTMTTKVVPRRSFSGIPAFNAQHLGEIIRSADGSDQYIAVQVGTGAGDWKAL
ncbi:right-handed parallel beta-helix repeat-containing protein [Paenibacillus sp. H1-7]|uniref:right-handed parallel beta-helix repeat-containing protein n=1 Tax=Paenibacillus sp. H1-7 TaxID=2282849 RepID=UPI001EF7A265|nr:right-handed parallel beta-helix repeat-containing protein [Paenibacillus sp. H1-7]ULL16647.1 right-handed parallel beta-helix repeat-containing protein [Paenibacillus sp. H1-7]